MELLYVWIEDYKNIHYQGFNFNPKYRFEFEPTEFRRNANGKLPKDQDGEDIVELIGGTLKDEMAKPGEENALPENFFRENITNVTAIIGQNGAGKSNLLDFIRIVLNHFLNSQEMILVNSKFLFLIKHEDEEDKKEKFFYLHPKGFNLQKDECFENGKNIIKSATVVYYSSLFDLSNKVTVENDSLRENRQFQVLLTQKSKLVSTNGESIDLILNKYKSDRVFEQLEFLIRIPADSKEYQLPFLRPKKIIFKFKRNEISKFIAQNRKEEIAPKLEIVIEAFKKFYDTKSQGATPLKFKVKLKILNALNILKRTIIPHLKYTIKDDSVKHIYNLLNQLFEVEQKVIEVNSVKRYFEEYFDVEKKINKEHLVFQNLIKELEELNEVNLEYPTPGLEISINAEIFQKIHKDEELRFLIFELFDFSWDVILSTGEESMLSLYSSFFSVAILANKEKDPSSKYEQSRNILILIDEGEVGFHPEWQRKYLKYLIDFIPQIYPDKQIQIILTTHSPFLASDLPKENIIFLKKGKKGEMLSDGADAEGKCILVNGLSKEKTFAANIHTLLSDSFFLEGGLIGEFASGKIKDIQKFYKEVKEIEKAPIEEKTFDNSKENVLIEKKKEYESKKDAFWKIQRMIGEDYLAAIIKNHLDEMETILYGIDAANDEKIDRLRKELKALEEEKGKKRK